MNNRKDFPDTKLAARLEHLDALCQTEFVATHRQVIAVSPAEFVEIGAGIAAFVSPDSPITQVIGMGFSDKLSQTDLDGMETFYTERKAPIHIELSHLAEPWALEYIQSRGYRATEFSAVHCLTLTEAHQMPESDAIIEIGESEYGRYGDLLACGFTGAETAPPELAELGRIFAHEKISTCYVSTHTITFKC